MFKFKVKEMFNFFVKIFKNVNGIKVINNTLGQFEKIKADLEKGVQHCKTIVAENDSKIKEIETDTKNQKDAQARAEKVINNLGSLLL